jgi:hypothetical protein
MYNQSTMKNFSKSEYQQFSTEQPTICKFIMSSKTTKHQEQSFPFDFNGIPSG